jgi:hypothetical protein
MIKNQKLRDWLAEQPLILAFTRPSALVSMDRERALALIISPVLAGALVIGGGIGAGYAAGGNNSPTVQNTIETSIAEPVVEEREVEEVIVDIDPVEQAIATWGEPDIAAILSEAFPEAEWSLNGNSYSGLTWFGPGAKPTEAEIRRLWVTLGGVFLERQQLAEAEAEAEAAERKAAEEVRAADPTRQELCQAIDYKALYGPGIDYTKILSVHYPGAQWSLNGSAYSGLTWISPGTKPTQATLDGLWDGVAFGLCLQKPLTELQARAGTSETEEFVDGAVRPKGYSEGTFTPSLANCNQLPQVPSDGGGSPAGSVQIYNDPTGGQNFEQIIGMGLGDFACRLAEAHGWFGGQYSMGISVNGERTVMWYSSQVDPSTVRALLSSLGAALEPIPEPEAEPTPDAE